MPQYKLSYFNVRARAETARLVLAVAGVEYEDIRLSGEDWRAKVKPTSPFGQMPLLEVDGTTICQGNVIARFLAEEHGLGGDTALQRAQAAMIIDCMEDMRKPLAATFSLEKQEDKDAARKKYAEETLPGFLAKFEALLKANGGGDGYFVGDKMTYADLSFYHWIDWFPCINVNFSLDEYPKIKSLTERVAQHPKVAEWVEKRPKTNL